MATSENETTYTTTVGTTAPSSLTRSNGLNLSLSKAIVSLALPADGSTAIPPEGFKLTWELSYSTPAHHRLDRIVFKCGTGRFVVPLPDSIPLEGVKGEVPFQSAASPELATWRKAMGGSSIVADFVFREVAKSSERASEEQSPLNIITRHAQNDVVFVFPPKDKNASTRLLWSRSEVLAKSSPYFKTLFDSDGFTETTELIDAPGVSSGVLGGTAAVMEVQKTPISKSIIPSGGKGGGGGACQITNAKRNGKPQEDDSHDEAEEEDVYSSLHEDSDVENDYFPSPSPSPSIHRIVIHGVAYKTLLAYLYYIETNSVTFDPLSSLLPPSYSPPPYKPSSAPSCSPKSMYNLAKFYEHQTLCELAYTSIASQLDCCNALLELFSDLSANFEEIKALCIQAVLDNWKYIKDSKQMKELQEEMKSGNLESRKLGLMFDLFSKLQPATS